MDAWSEEDDSFPSVALVRLARPIRREFRRLMILAAAFAVLATAFPFVTIEPSVRDPAGDVNRSGALAITGAAFLTSANGTTPAYVNQTVSFWARATTDSAASLTFTIYYDYYLPGSVVNPASPVSVNFTGNPGNIVTTFVYDHVGNLSGASGTYFHARCIITDGVSAPITLNRYAYVIENQPPDFNWSLEPTILVNKGVPENLSTQVIDTDDDSLQVTWEWGDGSANATNVTGPAAAGVWCNQTHTWDPYVTPGTGNFYIYTTLNVTLDDGFGNIVVGKYTVKIFVPKNSPPTISLTAPYSAGTNSTVLFQGTAVDQEGEDLTWVFDFKDGSPLEVYHTAGVLNATVWLNVTHSFQFAGTYNVLMNVSDVPIINPGFPHNQSISKQVIIKENQPPGVSDEINVDDENPLINWTTGNATVTFTVQAADLDGDPLLVVWNFSDGSPEVTNSTTGGAGPFTFIQLHAYTVPGQYNITANVTDGQGHWVLTYRIINVSSDNTPPEFVSSNITYPQGRGDYATPNETVYITYVVKDDQFDPIRLLIDWGDGSPVLNITLSDYVNGTVTYVANHSYAKVGEYTVKVNITDNQIGKGMHAFNFSLNVKIDYEPNLDLNPWSWWDYTTLGILLMIPILIALWWVNERRKQKALDDAGVTYDQWLVRKKEIQEELRMKKSG